MIPAVDAETELDEEEISIPADPAVRNFSYTVIDDQVYYRVNSVMNLMRLPAATAERVKGLVGIRDCVRNLINLQMDENTTEEAIKAEQGRLNTLYDTYTEKYGVIGNNANKHAFSEDSSYCLLCSFEDLDEDGRLREKAQMFYKRTIKKAVPVTSVETASEALALSLNEKARVDMGFMIGKDQIYLNAFIKFCEESFPDESAITREIVDSWLCSYKKYLGDVLSQSDNIEDVRKAAELLIKLAEYKPLAKVEELEEENLNQIDNYLSNTVPKAEERKEIRNVEHERIEEEERKRRYKGKPSLRARLAEKKAIVAERGTVPQPEKHPVKILFENADGYDCVFVFADLFSTLYT